MNFLLSFPTFMSFQTCIHLKKKLFGTIWWSKWWPNLHLRWIKSKTKQHPMLPIKYRISDHIWHRTSICWARPSRLSLKRNTRPLSLKCVTHIMIHATLHVRSTSCALWFIFPVNRYSSFASTVKHTQLLLIKIRIHADNITWYLFTNSYLSTSTIHIGLKGPIWSVSFTKKKTVWDYVNIL